jgi:DNA replication and repair protein RecF
VTLLSIELENFRNLPALQLSLDARGAVLEAPNGRGKTNFLEAIHYLTLFRSFRGATDVELVRFGETGFHVRGELAAQAGHPPRGVGIAVEGSRKRLSVDGRAARPAEHVGTALSVVLSPADIRLVQGSPARRRRYLDVALSLCSRRYVRALQDYGRALKQRNRLLQAGGSGAQPALLEPWTEQLARHGAAILEARLRFLARWGARFGEISARLAGSGTGVLGWRYESAVAQPTEILQETLAGAGLPAESAGSVPSPVGALAPADGSGPSVARHAAGGTDPAPRGETAPAWESGTELPLRDAEGGCGLESALRAALERRAFLERRRGLTLVGPHRDDLQIYALGSDGVERDLRRFGSQGEQRTAALALRFLECEVLTRERNQLPVVLLDDVFSELDPRRSKELLTFLTPGQQVFLTTPKPLLLELPVELPRYTVAAGTVRAA